jgi:hypothetical protein
MRRRWYASSGPYARCGARLSGGRGRCRAWALKGKRRCKWHGGKSTGPRDWRASVAAMVAGRKRYIERRHAMGLKAPGGRLPSAAKMMTTMDRAIEVANELLRRIEEERARKHEATPKS